VRRIGGGVGGGVWGLSGNILWLQSDRQVSSLPLLKNQFLSAA
jgi:hypothetical protein